MPSDSTTPAHVRAAQLEQEARRSARLQLSIDEIFIELRRAEALHPSWPADPVYGAAIVGEETGELIRAALRHTYEGVSRDEMRKEAVQTAAMAIRFLINLETGK